MEKIYGSPVRQDGLYKTGRNKWELIYGFGKDNPDDETGWNWRLRLSYRPLLEEIKEAIIGAINSDTDERILRGFTWQGIPVWLSTENQINLKASCDMARDTSGESLPAKFKLGETPEGEPIYHTFETVEEFTGFIHEMLNHITAAVTAGYAEKDSIDWDVYAETK